MDNEILDYKDLAAIPKVKAIYDIERPDLITYEPFYTSGYDDKQERQSLGEVINSRSCELYNSFAFVMCMRTTEGNQNKSQGPFDCLLFAGLCTRCFKVLRSLSHHPPGVRRLQRGRRTDQPEETTGKDE